MATLQVDSLLFSFSGSVTAELYDRWIHYCQVFNASGGQKAVDVVAIEENGAAATTWLIEAKDFRVITNPPKPANIGGLPQQIADKVHDTIVGLRDAAINAIDPREKQHSANAMVSPIVRIVLHLEPHVGPHSALFPSRFAVNVFQRLRQLVNQIDPNALVLNISNTPMAGVPWTVS